MQIALITDGGFPFRRREGGAWCERLVTGLASHEFEVYALTPPPAPGAAPAGAAPGMPANVTALHVLPPTDARRRPGAPALARYRELLQVLAEPDRPTADGTAAPADRFAAALYALADTARATDAPAGLPRSDAALRVLEGICRAPGARPVLRAAGLRDLLTAAGLLTEALAPLFSPWYEPDRLGAADLCHAASGGPAVLPGLLAKRFFGTPLLVTEYGVRLRETLLAHHAAGHSAPVRALLTAFHRLLAVEACRQAAALTPGNAHARRWQELCGADRARIRTVNPGYPGLAERPVPAPAAPDSGPPTLLWTGRPEPAKDLVGLLHAFAEVRRTQPGARARLRVVLRGGGSEEYVAHCRQLAAHLFPDEAASAVASGENPVSFEPQARAGAAAGDVVVMSSVVEGFPHGLVEAMFAERATVSTDVGAVREVIGGTGLVVPPRNPRALAEACAALLGDPERRDRLGAAARERALELFSVEQNLRAFREIYLGVVAHGPVAVPTGAAAAVPFAQPAESHLSGRWGPVPGWAAARLREDPA